MIRQTYKGRKILIVKGGDRNRGGRAFAATVNGGAATVYGTTQEKALAEVQADIDAADREPVGAWDAYWYAPGTFELCPAGNAKAVGGPCRCWSCRDDTAAGQDSPAAAAPAAVPPGVPQLPPAREGSAGDTCAPDAGPARTQGQKFTALARQRYRIGPRTSRYREGLDLFDDLVQEIMCATRLPGYHDEPVEAVFRPAWWAAVRYLEEIKGFRATGTVIAKVTTMTPWQFTGMLGDMIDAGVTSTTDAEDFFSAMTRADGNQQAKAAGDRAA